jgi:hypothetical protein
VVELVADIDVDATRARLEEVRGVAGPDVRILVATKYVPLELMGGLAEAGVDLVGENRLQDLAAKQERWGDAFEWDFIGNLQSRKAVEAFERARLVHTLASESALERLGRAEPGRGRALVQVNVAGEESKGGIEPADLGAFIERAPVEVVGLMTMPPASDDPEASRPYFARLAELASQHDLRELSIGTSQDWRVAVEEGATIIRLGSSLVR